MRRALLISGIFAMIGCGISAVATRDGAGPVDPTEDGATNPNIPDTSSSSDGTFIGDAGLEADTAEPVFPSHINTADYTLETNAVSITTESTIDTSAMKGLLNGTDAITLTPGTLGAAPIAVWSVGPLMLSGFGNLTVTGSKALVIVVNGDFTSSNTIRLGASDPLADGGDVPGPGGTTPGAGGVSVGGPGQSTTNGGGGGGGGGHATAGGVGGQGSGGTGAGGAGKIVTGVALIGGRGGGNGGQYAMAACGRGGNGGGALQLSVHGKMTFNVGSIIDVSGGGGHGGCKSSGGTPAGGGGGGGAGGLIYLEATGDITAPALTGVVAAGGGGGAGGDNNNDGLSGTTPDFYSAPGGGFGNGNGGKGGRGGTASNGSADAGATLFPENGEMKNAGGGAGGAVGRVFFRTQAPATITLGAYLYAESHTESF